jgi:hypothetical protein
VFPDLQLEVLDRFTALEQYFLKSPRKPDPLAQMAKGLVFVPVYAVYEHTAKSVMRLAVDEIVAHAHKYSDLTPALLAVFLSPEVDALRQCPDKGEWERRFSLCEKALSDDPIMPVNVMPHDGSHFRHTQITVMLRALGVRRSLTLRRRHLYKIDEVVNNRNAIAHGLETPADVGRRYSRNDVVKNIRLMRGICLRLVKIVSEHCKLPDRHCRIG